MHRGRSFSVIVNTQTNTTHTTKRIVNMAEKNGITLERAKHNGNCEKREAANETANHEGYTHCTQWNTEMKQGLYAEGVMGPERFLSD